MKGERARKPLPVRRFVRYKGGAYCWVLWDGGLPGKSALKVKKQSMKNILPITMLGAFAVLLSTVRCDASEIAPAQGVATLANAAPSNIPKSMRVRVTYYVSDPKWGSQISSDPKGSAIAGRTAAVDPEIFPYGSVIHLPLIGEVVAEDTGTDVKSRKASRRHNDIPVIDVFVSNEEEAEKLAREMPEVMLARVLFTPQQRNPPPRTERKTPVVPAKIVPRTPAVLEPLKIRFKVDPDMA